MPERLSDEQLAIVWLWHNARTYLADDDTLREVSPILAAVPAMVAELVERRAAELRIVRDSELGELKRMLPIDGHGWLVMHVNDLLAIVDAWLEREADESAEHSR